ncbi:MAG TPA: efflux RND transporter periplasmic adaptor subunit [Thermoanaerobaculia bacterium]
MRSAANDDPSGIRPAWRWGMGLLAVLLLVGVVAAIARPRGPSVEVVAVKRGDLLVPIQCDGSLEPPPGGELRSPQSATVAEILVREGDRVTTGTPLLRLAEPELAQKATDARAEVLRLAGERAGVASELSELERQEKHQQEILASDARLLASGAITRMAYEQDELALRQAQDRARAARARLAALGGSSKSVASRIELAERSASELERRVAGLTVRAPAAGLVYGLPRRTGEAIGAGEVVANVIDPEHRRVRARVDQPDLPRIAPGQRLILGFDGLPGQRWEGRITFVAPGLREVGGREVGEVLGEIADPQGRLPSNAAVELQIVTGEKHGALVVPRASVFREGERRFVYLLDGGRARRREVQVGLLGLTEVEIRGGIRERDTVILPGSTPLADGLRVRATRGLPRP